MPTSSADFNDFFIEKDDDGVYDFVVENGQFKSLKSFDTALQMIMHCERRADPSEVPMPQYRRGWLGNSLLFDTGFEVGSKLWLLFQERVTEATLNKAIDYVRQASEWLIEDGHLKTFEVRGEFLYEDGMRNGIRLYIDYVTYNNKVESRYYDLWQNTGNRTIIESTSQVGYLLLDDEGSRLELSTLEDETSYLLLNLPRT